jgi:hypothetical protein
VVDLKWDLSSNNAPATLLLLLVKVRGKNDDQYKTIFNSTIIKAGNTNVGSITEPLTSCLDGLESAVCLQTIFIFICKTE